MTELYLGLAAIEAGVFGIFVAALFVLVEVSASEFSSRLPGLILSRKSFWFLTMLVALTMTLALLGGLRSGFPGTDAVGTVDFRTDDVFVKSVWAAVGLILAVLISALWCLVLLFRLVRQFNRAAIVRWALGEGSFEQWRRYAEYRFGLPPVGVYVALTRGNLPERFDFGRMQGEQREYVKALEEDVRKGSLVDPLAVVVDILSSGIRCHEYQSMTLGLDTFCAQLGAWIDDHRFARGATTGPPSAWDPRVGELARCAKLLRDYLEVLVQTACAVPYRAMISPVLLASTGLSVRFLENDYVQGGEELTDFLVAAGERFDDDGDDENLRQVAQGLLRVGSESARMLHQEMFDAAARGLGCLGERVATRPIPEARLLGLFEHDPLPLGELQNALWHLGESLCPQRAKVLLDPLIFRDSNYVIVHAMLGIRPFTDRYDEYAVKFTENIGTVAVAAATEANDRALWLACTDLKEIQKQATDAGADGVRRSITHDLFHSGLIAAGNNGPVSQQQVPIPGGGDRVELVLESFEGVELEHVLSAKDNYYLSGYMSHIASTAQRDFVRRLGARLGYPDLDKLH